MSKTFNGRAALVTGASSGLGRAIALRLGKAGMEQWLAGRSAEGLAETAALIAKAGGGATHCEVLDLQQRGGLSALIERIGAAHPHFFALINNAGLMHPEPIMSGHPERWQAMFDVNVLAPLEASYAAISLMRRQGKAGHVVNISSLAARFDAGGVYGASKAALEMISRSLRRELEHDDIRVSTIVPGGFATQLGRSFEPETLQVLADAAKGLGMEFGGPDSGRLLGDADYIAKAVAFVLAQPPEINMQEIVVRPPVSLEY
jgi:NADP-dependent 3-hydroxy acid dehydrogenase YdfG